MLRASTPSALMTARLGDDAFAGERAARRTGAPAVSGGWPAAEPPDGAEDRMIALFLLLVIVAIVLGIVGVVAKGLLYLLIIGIVVFLGALLWVPCGCGAGRQTPGQVVHSGHR